MVYTSCMSSYKNLIAILIVLVIIGIGVSVVINQVKKTREPAQPDVQNAASQPTAPPFLGTGNASENSNDNLILISANGFAPADFKMKVGQTVTWQNVDTVDHQVNSDPHPTHERYPLVNDIGLLKPGDKKLITITSDGSYGFHDHLNPKMTGHFVVIQ